MSVSPGKRGKKASQSRTPKRKRKGNEPSTFKLMANRGKKESKDDLMITDKLDKNNEQDLSPLSGRG
jgi:hypothetical protein